MSYRRKHPNSWLYIVIGTICVSLLWFFSDLKNTESMQVISDVEREVATPIENNITIDSLSKLANRLVISEIELSSIPSYGSKTLEKPNNQNTTTPRTANTTNSSQVRVQ